MYLTLIPAYGRDYLTETAVRRAWEAGHDFTIVSLNTRWHGAKINIEDFNNSTDIDGVVLRYNKQTKVLGIDRKPKLRVVPELQMVPE